MAMLLSALSHKKSLAVYPQLTTESEERLSVNYNGLVGLLIQAVKELSAEVEELKSRK